MYVYVYLFNLHIYLTVLLTSGASSPAKREIVDHNPNQDFRCDDGHDIARIFVCDGIPDCDDNSDETRDQCRNISCSDQNFRCDYGACISKEYLCDGLKQCIDGSDETPRACNISSVHKSTRSKRAAGDSCPKPAPFPDKNVTFNCDGTSSKSCGTRDGYVPELTVATIKCKPNYYPEKKLSHSFCYENNWEPQFDKCFKKCEKLNPVNVDMKCIRRGVYIPCDEDSLLAGSIVRPVCKESHKYGDSVPDYKYIVCKEDGKWDKTLFYCIPETCQDYNTKGCIRMDYDPDYESFCCTLFSNSTQSFSSSKPENQTELNSDANDSKNSHDSTSANQTTRKSITKGIARLAVGFDYIFYKSNPNENFILAPLNVARIIAAIWLGSTNKTAVELSKLQNVLLKEKTTNYRVEEFHQELANLSYEVNTYMKDGVALFIQKENPIQVAFMNQVARLYNADVIKLDFKKGGKEPEIAVNKWASDYSANKIKEITQLPIDQITVFLAIGVSYFNGDWEHPFFVKETRQQLFFTRGENGENIDYRVDMMFGRAPIPYYEDEEVGYRAIILPYKNKSMHMYVILPRQNKTLKNLTESLNHGDFANIAEKSTISEVFYAIPKMHLEMTNDLKSALRQLGVETLFDPVRANFSKITDKQIRVSEILQNVVIDVNEKAGDTTTNIGTTISYINKDKYINFTVDRPFTFFIFDAKAKVMTLWASIYKPTPYK